MSTRFLESAINTLKLPIILFASLAVSISIGSVTTPYMAAASFAYFLLIIGLYFRTIRAVHIKLMSAAIIFDLALVLTLELQRSAIKTASSFELNLWQQGHILTATLATIAYIPTFYLGYKRSKNLLDKNATKKHIRFGLAAFIFRSISFFLMFSMLEHVAK